MDGKCVIFSAPSGAGKTTIVHHLLQNIPNLIFSISATTRKPRGAEQNGSDYYFMTEENFRSKIDAGEFVEWEEVYSGCFYGTLRTEVERIWNEGKHVVFDVDVVGGRNLKEAFGDKALSIFVMPPDLEELRKRLSTRSTDSADSIDIRLKKAEKEMKFAKYFDRILINDKLEQALDEADKLVTGFIES